MDFLLGLLARSIGTALDPFILVLAGAAGWFLRPARKAVLGALAAALVVEGLVVALSQRLVPYPFGQNLLPRCLAALVIAGIAAGIARWAGRKARSAEVP